MEITNSLNKAEKTLSTPEGIEKSTPVPDIRDIDKQIEFNKEEFKHKRKQKRLEIAQDTIKYCFIGLGAIAFSLLLIWTFSFVTSKNVGTVNVVLQVFQFLGASVFSILTLALGFVAGSSID